MVQIRSQDLNLVLELMVFMVEEADLVMEEEIHQIGLHIKFVERLDTLLWIVGIDLTLSIMLNEVQKMLDSKILHSITIQDREQICP